MMQENNTAPRTGASLQPPQTITSTDGETVAIKTLELVTIKRDALHLTRELSSVENLAQVDFEALEYWARIARDIFNRADALLMPESDKATEPSFDN